MTFSLDGLNNRSEMNEERINALNDESIEFSNLKSRKEKS